MGFGEKVKALLDSRGISIAEAARMTGLPDSTIRSIIARNSDTVNIKAAVAISKAFHIGLDEIEKWGVEGTGISIDFGSGESAITMGKEPPSPQVQAEVRELAALMAQLPPEDLSLAIEFLQLLANRAKQPADRSR